jgi:hypothetical protein
VDRIERLISKDGVIDFVFVLAAEGRLLEQHLVNQHAKGPPIDGPTVLLVEQNLHLGQLPATGGRKRTTYLGGHKLRSTTERTRRRPVPHLFLTQTVISNLDMPVHCQENIVKFQISVDDTVLVEIL